MSEVLAPERDGTERLGSVYDAALARHAVPTSRSSETIVAMETDENGKAASLPMVIAPGTGGRFGAPTPDWSATIGLVERAAATIKAYERRFVQLDIHTRALIERSSEEQARMQDAIDSLELRLRDSEDRVARAEAAARDEAFYRWEAERRCREAEARVMEAEDHSRQSEDYLRRVHVVLSEL